MRVLPIALAGLLLLTPGCGPSPKSRRDTLMEMNNLRQVSIGLHAYHEVHNKLPPSAIRGPDGKPLLSWRVALLPFLERDDLYRKFHLNEPWDSPHNKSLLSEMPAVFGANGDGTTTFQVFVGPTTMFPAEGQLQFRDARDGIANVLAMISVGPDKAVPWTQPVDVQFDPQNPLGNAGQLNEHVLVSLADGTVYHFQRDAPAEDWRRVIQCADGAVSNIDSMMVR